MQTYSKLKKEVVLILDENEAALLQSMVQNPIREDESSYISNLREKLFNAINNELKR